MTPERLNEDLVWLRSAVSYTNDERCRLALHSIEREIERLRGALAQAIDAMGKLINPKTEWEICKTFAYLKSVLEGKE